MHSVTKSWNSDAAEPHPGTVVPGVEADCSASASAPPHSAQKSPASAPHAAATASTCAALRRGHAAAASGTAEAASSSIRHGGAVEGGMAPSRGRTP